MNQKGPDRIYEQHIYLSGILSWIAWIVRGKSCCDACFVVLVPGEPARASSFKVGYMASNLSVACSRNNASLNCRR